MELLYADDLVLIAETEELLVERVKRWKQGMEEKGLRVNMGKTKVMRCHVVSGQTENSGKWPCSVCRKGVGANSVKCEKCKMWVHKKCSGVSGSLVSIVDFCCKKCVEGNQTQTQVQTARDLVLGPGEKLECVDKFCYLGDMLGSGGGVEVATRARVRCAWAKFRELAPILTVRGASLKVKGKVYRTYVRSVLVYGSETWATKVEDMQKLERTERMMVRWMCGVRRGISSRELNLRLGIECVTDVVKRGRLRWFGHLERKPVDDWVSVCRNFEVEGVRGRGRGKKTWGECVRVDMDQLGLRSDWAQDRDRWRNLIWGNRPTRAGMEKRTINR
jgi:hypothetical protein